MKINTKLCRDAFDVIINTTSAGMEPQLDALPTDAIDGVDVRDFLNERTAAADMIYNPDETLFLKEAKKRGAKTLNGLGMLIYQGIASYEIWHDTKVSNFEAKEIRNMLAEYFNNGSGR